MDMSSVQVSYASPEFQLTKAAVAQIGRYYELPTWGYSGCSDAKVFDEQAAAEAMLSVLMAELGGSNLVHDVGYMECGMTTSPEMIVLTDELVGLARNITKGIEVNDETLSLEVIDRVARQQGDFFAEPETVRHFRDFWFPCLMDRYSYETWQADGSLNMNQRVNNKTLEIMKHHRPESLPKNIIEQLMGVIDHCKHT